MQASFARIYAPHKRAPRPGSCSTIHAAAALMVRAWRRECLAPTSAKVRGRPGYHGAVGRSEASESRTRMLQLLLTDVAGHSCFKSVCVLVWQQFCPSMCSIRTNIM